MESKKENIWKVKYLLHIKGIDKQHQHFFLICSKIASLCDMARSGKKVSLGRFLVTIFELRSYAFKHFYTEERLLVKYNYPNLFSHIELHDSYLEKIHEFTRNIKKYHKHAQDPAGQEFINEVEIISDFALSWWSDHIMENDKEYADFIKKVGRKKAKEESLYDTKTE